MELNKQLVFECVNLYYDKSFTSRIKLYSQIVEEIELRIMSMHKFNQHEFIINQIDERIRNEMREVLRNEFDVKSQRIVMFIFYIIWVIIFYIAILNKLDHEETMSPVSIQFQ